MRMLVFFLLFILFGSISSCKKDKATDFYFQNQVPILIDGVNIMGFPPTVRGSMIAIKRNFIYINGTDTVISGGSVGGYAIFLKNEEGQTGADAGTVSLNNVSLATNNPVPGTALYYSIQSGDSVYFIHPYFPFDVDSAAHWNVTGSSEIPAIAYDYSGTFPEYIGKLPFTITKANGLTLTFDSSTVTGADSVNIIITDSMQEHIYSVFVSATAGTVHISSSGLANLSNKYTYDDNSVGAWLKIYSYKYTVQTLGTKQFAFVKEREIWQAITIN